MTPLTSLIPSLTTSMFYEFLQQIQQEVFFRVSSVLYMFACVWHHRSRKERNKRLHPERRAQRITQMKAVWRKTYATRYSYIEFSVHFLFYLLSYFLLHTEFTSARLLGYFVQDKQLSQLNQRMESNRRSEASIEELLALKLQLAHMEQELQAERVLVAGLRTAANRTCADIVAALSSSSPTAASSPSAAAGSPSATASRLSRHQVFALFARHFGPYSARDNSASASPSQLLFGQQALTALSSGAANSVAATAPLPVAYASRNGGNMIEYEEESQLVVSDRL